MTISPISLTADTVCASIGDAVVAAARQRSPHAYVDCHVVLAYRTVVVAGELGFWPPLGAYEGVCGDLEGLVRGELEAARCAGWQTDGSVAGYTVINCLKRVGAERARHLASLHEQARATEGLSIAFGHAAIRSRRPTTAPGLDGASWPRAV